MSKALLTEIRSIQINQVTHGIRDLTELVVGKVDTFESGTGTDFGRYHLKSVLSHDESLKGKGEKLYREQFELVFGYVEMGETLEGGDGLGKVGETVFADVEVVEVAETGDRRGEGIEEEFVVVEVDFSEGLYVADFFG